MIDRAMGIARLAGALRAHGVPTNLKDEIDGAEALRVVDPDDRDEVRLALRIAFKIRRLAFDTFDRLFAIIWADDGSQPAPMIPPAARREQAATPRARVLRWDPDARRLLDGAGVPGDGEVPGRVGFSPEALLRRRSFDQVSPTAQDLASMERLLARLARRLARRPSRRLVPTRGPGRPDLRASLQRALRTSGEIVTFARRTRKVERPKLAFLCDTSGSMDAHTRFLLMFILALRRVLPKAELFAFNTELVRLNPALSRGNARLALDRLAARVPDWSGGTRIGDSLATFVEKHLERCVDGKTVVVIMSDGLDRGDPETLAAALRTIQGRARKIVWLNPLMGDPDYEPLTRGTRAALPFVDHFAAADSIESLERVLVHLTGRT